MDLKTPVMGVPVGLLGVVVVGGLGIGYYFNKRAANKADQPTQLTEGGVGAGGSGFDNVSPPSTNPTVIEETNQTWGRKVTQYLIAQGMDPGIADNAVRKYLNSQNLTLQEQAMINSAIVKLGPAPEPLAPVVIPVGKPAPVTGLKAAQAGDSATRLTWEPVAGADHYSIDVVAVTGHWIYSSDTNSFTNSGQIPKGLKHTYTVYAVNETGKSSGVSVSFQNQVGGGGSTPAPKPVPAPQPAPQQRTETVRPGDTLTAISLRVYGTAGRWREIYNRNSGVIESAARAHGRPSSAGGPRKEIGWYIYAGTKLIIP